MAERFLFESACSVPPNTISQGRRDRGQCQGRTDGGQKAIISQQLERKHKSSFHMKRRVKGKKNKQTLASFHELHTPWDAAKTVQLIYGSCPFASLSLSECAHTWLRLHHPPYLLLTAASHHVSAQPCMAPWHERTISCLCSVYSCTSTNQSGHPSFFCASPQH